MFVPSAPSDGEGADCPVPRDSRRSPPPTARTTPRSATPQPANPDPRTPRPAPLLSHPPPPPRPQPGTARVNHAALPSPPPTSRLLLLSLPRARARPRRRARALPPVLLPPAPPGAARIGRPPARPLPITQCKHGAHWPRASPPRAARTERAAAARFQGGPRPCDESGAAGPFPGSPPTFPPPLSPLSPPPQPHPQTLPRRTSPPRPRQRRAGDGRRRAAGSRRGSGAR